MRNQAFARIYTANKSGELLFEFQTSEGKTWYRLGLFDEIACVRERLSPINGTAILYVDTKSGGHYGFLMGAKEFFELLRDCRELEALYKKAKAEGVPF